jgi:hypothetical protein
MMKPSSATALAWGVGAILAGGLMADGGVREVRAYAPFGAWTHVAVGACGALASTLFAAGGLALCTGRAFARGVAAAGALAMIPVHLIGALLGYVGIPGDLLGIAYPLALLLAIAARPRLGAPRGTAIAPSASGPHARPSQPHETGHRLADDVRRAGGARPAPLLL